jgi:F-box interacting protein
VFSSSSSLLCLVLFFIFLTPFEPIIIALGFHGLHKQPTFAFGYDPVNNDYKVVRIVVFVGLTNEVGEVKVKVYSLKAHSWRRIEDKRPCKNSLLSFEMVFSNGALHWCGLMNGTEGGLLHSISPPRNSKTIRLQLNQIRIILALWRFLGGSLCVSTDARTTHYDEPQQADVWIDDEGVRGGE